MFIDCTSNSEDHFEITSAGFHSSLTLSQPITQGCLHGGRNILGGGTTFFGFTCRNFGPCSFKTERHNAIFVWFVCPLG